jgi:hypothetical protein
LTADSNIKFLGHNKVIYGVVAMAAVMQVILLLALVPGLGASGAAMASALTMGFMHGNLGYLAHRRLEALRLSS